MSFAPRDSHEAQVQFALERGVPAVIGVLGTIKMPYPSRAFDMAHCSRCLIPWGASGKDVLKYINIVASFGGSNIYYDSALCMTPSCDLSMCRWNVHDGGRSSS